jgi:transcriptional regulator with XRE-family HTH domain
MTTAPHTLPAVTVDELVARVRAWRRHRRMSQDELSELAGMAPRLWSKVELWRADGSGPVSAKPPTLRLVMAALDAMDVGIVLVDLRPAEQCSATRFYEPFQEDDAVQQEKVPHHFAAGRRGGQISWARHSTDGRPDRRWIAQSRKGARMRWQRERQRRRMKRQRVRREQDERGQGSASDGGV